MGGVVGGDTRQFVFGAETVEDERYEILIAETIQRLPKDVRDEVLGKVNFIVAGGVDGTFFTVNVLNYVVDAIHSTRGIKRRRGVQWVKLSAIEEADLKLSFILLNFAKMREKSEEEIMSIIAHEIAHFILRHTNDKPRAEKEKEADDLIEKWGLREPIVKHRHTSQKIFHRNMWKIKVTITLLLLFFALRAFQPPLSFR
jgi:predicted SprT family Zn-dependent metalloprotease